MSNLTQTTDGFLASEKQRKIKNLSIEDELNPSSTLRFKNRKQILARYIAVLIAHEIIWESSFLNEINSFFDFFKDGVLKLVKGEEDLVVKKCEQINYIDDFDGDTIMRINEQLQNQIAISLLEHSEENDTQDMLKLTIVILDFVFQSNSKKHRIAEDSFINDTCSNNLNLRIIAKQYYNKKVKKLETGIHNNFVYLDYPWMFSTEAKVEIIHLESNVSMHQHLNQMIDELNLDGGLLPGLFGGAQIQALENNLTLNVEVRRSHLLNDSLKMLSTQSKNFKKQLKIKFQGEEGVDQGGVKKEFFHLLMKELFNPNYAMFESKFNVEEKLLGSILMVQ